MRLLESIFLSLSVVTFIIGVHQSFFWGVTESYWLFMLSGSFFLLFRYQKINAPKATPQPEAVQGKNQVVKTASKKHRKK